MSMHPKGPLPKKQQQVQVDLRDAETIKCEDCNNYLWIQSFVLKRLSAIVSPNILDPSVCIIEAVTNEEVN